jgi:ankyrin repeat protein
MRENPKLVSLFKVAVQKNNAVVIRHMLDQKAVSNRDRSVGLHKAIAAGHEPIARMLLEDRRTDGADVNLDHYLCLALKMGREPIAEWLLEQGASPSGANIGGCSALGSAIRSGSLAMVRRLLDCGADVGAIDRNGHSAAMLAACEASTEVLKSILDSGARMDLALSSAVRSNRYAHAQLLLLRGADANESNEAGITPLMYALLHGSPRMVRLLMRYGAKPDQQDRDGESALTYASRHGKRELYSLLNGRSAP